MEELPDDDQVNEMMAINDKEMQLYKRMDAERLARNNGEKSHLSFNKMCSVFILLYYLSEMLVLFLLFHCCYFYSYYFIRKSHINVSRRATILATTLSLDI